MSEIADVLLPYGVYSYVIPPSLKERIKVGIRVKVYVRKRLLWGIVTGINKERRKGLKPIVEVIDNFPIFSPSYISFAKKVSDYYASEWFEIINLSPLKDIENLSQDEEKYRKSNNKFSSYLLLSPSFEERWKIYSSLINEKLSNDEKVLFLFPEWETYSTLREKIISSFPEESTFFSSSLPSKRRRKAIKEVINGKAKIIAGTRSIMWLPIRNIGLIVLEDIHSTSYKNPSHPRYFLPEVALIRGREEKIKVLLSSPVPPIEFLHLLEKGEIEKFPVNSSFSPPKITLINMRREKRISKKRGLSDYLVEKIKEKINEEKNIALLVNRRGLAGYRRCKVCGYIQRCKKCGAPLSYHRPGIMICHQCGNKEEPERICPRCQSSYTIEKSSGTQKIEEKLKEIFPDIPVIRWDTDIKKKEKSIRKKESPFILVGTNLLQKYLKIWDIHLLGIVNADIHLFRPDFRSSEKTFQLLGELTSLMEGEEREIIVQTYHPENPSLEFGINLDWEGFYREELKQRKELSYPPFSHVFYVIIKGTDEEKIKDAVNSIKDIIKDSSISQVFFYGPSPFKRKNKIFSTQIMLKSIVRENLLKIVSLLKKERRRFNRKEIKVFFDPFPLE